MADERIEEGKPNTFFVGHRGGMVVVNNYGNEEVPPSWTAFTPDEARALANHLLKAADAAERKEEDTDDGDNPLD